MSEILNQTISIINHVKTDIENSKNTDEMIIPLDALHSAIILMGFKEDNQLVLHISRLEQKFRERNLNNKMPDTESAKKEILQLIEYLIEESKLVDSKNHNE